MNDMFGISDVETFQDLKPIYILISGSEPATTLGQVKRHVRMLKAFGSCRTLSKGSPSIETLSGFQVFFMRGSQGCRRAPTLG
jgi:hypothetical protein